MMFCNQIISTNRLRQGKTIKPDDFDSQVNADNYVYDLLGRVVEDKAKNLVQTYNKENKIITQTIGSKVITYKYDFQSKRVSKTVVNAGLTTTEYYVRDPQGNVLAIYADTLQNADRKFTLSELHIYGSSRLGIYKVDSVLWENGTTATSSNKYSFKLGQKRYELSNHLGNVSTTISDRKLVDVQTNGIIKAYKADVQSVTDYYPFGKTISERTWSISKTRYDFNGKETDQESGYQDYGFRDYDVEICRFLQVDPLHAKYPELSTYQFASNTPICAIDLDGKELWIANNEYSKNDILSLVDDKSLISFIPDGNYLKVEINYGEQDKNQLKKNDRGLELLSDIIFNTKGKKILYEADELTIYKNNGKIEGYPSFQGNGIANYSNGGKDSNNESIYTPKEDFDGQVVIDPFFKHYETYTNPTNGLDEKRPKRKQVVFHELAENFERTVNLKDYKSKSGKIGAHELANDREKLWKYKSLAPGEIRQISNVDRDLKNPNRTPHTEIFEKLSNLNKK